MNAVLPVLCLRQVSFSEILNFIGRKLFVVCCFFFFPPIGSSLGAVTKEVLEVVSASHLSGGLMEIIVKKQSKS